MISCRVFFSTKFFLLALVYFFAVGTGTYAQTKGVDSLLAVLEKQAPDTNRVQTLIEICGFYLKVGAYDDAAIYAEQALQLSEKINFKNGQAMASNSLGVVNKNHGNYPQSLRYHLRALKIREERHDSAGIAMSFMNIGILNDLMRKPDEAIENYNKAKIIFAAANNKTGIVACLINTGIVLNERKQPEKAMQCFSEALQIATQIKMLRAMAASHRNIGVSLGQMKKHEEALVHFFEAIRLFEESHNTKDLSGCYFQAGASYLSLGKFAESRKHLEQGLRYAQAAHSPEDKKSCYEMLSRLDSLGGNFKSAYVNYRLFIVCRDSLMNEENTKKTVQAQMQYDFDKKDAEQKIVQERQNAAAAEELKNQKTQRNYFIAGFLLVFLLAIFISVSFLQKRKANKLLEEKNILIENQKAIVEMKQKEVLDSIYYAKRIQTTLITSEKYIEKNLRRLK